ncbi:MAG: hypothetical protein ACP5KA_03950 [Desulfurococcaceae archaeon]
MSSCVKYRCDIDVLVVVDGIDASTKKKLVVDILERAIGVYGLPWDAPVELHIASRGKAERYFKHSRKVVEVA